MNSLRLALIVLLSAQPLWAEETAERYSCSVMQACDIGQPCRDDDGTLFELTFAHGGLEVVYGGQPLAAVFDPAFRAASWIWGDVVMQMRFVGDGSGVITVTPVAGEVERTQVQMFHCSPD